MTIANHMLAGSVIALTVQNPVVAVLLSISSHYLMDAMPHFGYKIGGYKEALRHRLTHYVVVFAALQTIAIILFLFLQGSMFAILCGLIAISPDGVAAIQFFAYENQNKKAPKILQRHAEYLHSRIQKFERPWGIVAEIIATVILSAVLLSAISAN